MVKYSKQFHEEIVIRYAYDCGQVRTSQYDILHEVHVDKLTRYLIIMDDTPPSMKVETFMQEYIEDNVILSDGERALTDMHIYIMQCINNRIHGR